MPRNDLTLADKIALIDQIKSYPPKTTTRQIAQLTGVPKSTISRVINQQVQLLEQWALGGKPKKRNRLGKYPDVKNALNEWYSTMSSQRARRNVPNLKTKAEELAKKLGHTGFKATNGWVSRWKARFNNLHGEIEPNQVLKKRKFNEDSSQPGTSSMADCDVPSAVNISMSALVATWVEKLNVTNPQQMKFAKKFIHEILSLAAQGKLHENSIHIDEDENSIDSNTVYDTQADQSEDETLELDAMDDIIDIKEELIEYPMMTENDTETENLNKTLPIEYNNPECSTLSLEIKQERDHTSDEDHTQTLNIDKHCKEKSDDIYMIDQSKDDFYYFGLSVGNKLRKINDLDEQQRYSCEKNILDALYNTLIEISSNRSNIEPTDIAKTHNIPKLVEVSA